MTDYTMNQDRCKFTPDEFKELVAQYIAEQIGKDCTPTVKHFALTHDVSRQQMNVKYKVDPAYKDAFEKLEDARDGMLEYLLVNESNRSPATLIFAAKNWLGMTDKKEIEHSEKVTDSGENEW